MHSGSIPISRLQLGKDKMTPVEQDLANARYTPSPEIKPLSDTKFQTSKDVNVAYYTKLIKCQFAF